MVHATGEQAPHRRCDLFLEAASVRPLLQKITDHGRDQTPLSLSPYDLSGDPADGINDLFLIFARDHE
jgi:hypothetical protein